MAGAALQPGSTFGGRYEILRCIGQGGMGAVYEVLHRETRRRRALKVLLPVLSNDAVARQRFSQEASITAEIDSDHLVEVYDAGIDPDSRCPFIVMELLRGETMGQKLERRERLSAPHVVEVLRQVAAGLELTHARAIVHRDLKPDNVFLTRREDGSLRVKVLDFGIAKVLETSGLSRNTVNIGTPLYMAPEQLDGGALSAQTDLFALTHIAFELLTGESYWEEEVRTAPSTMVLLRWMERGFPQPPSARAARLGVYLNAAFDNWFYKGVARDPRARFRSARELVDTLALALGVGENDSRMSLTGLMPADALGIPNAPPSVREGVSLTGDHPTQPFAGRAHRRTGEAVVSNLGKSRSGPPAWALALAGGAAALVMLAVVLFFIFRDPEKKSAANVESNPNDARSSGPPVASSAPPPQVTVTPSTAAAQSAPTVVASASVTPSGSPTTKPSAIKTTTPVRVDPCKRDPSRCRR